ncbi:MAG: DMT family transporter [Alphaproteobacteria bacterium]|nr:MAG: DMT family transporter [Alphaproteobacteria bacterium]
MLFFSMMDAMAKELATRHDPFQVVWARYVSQTFWAVLVLAPRLRRVMRTPYLGLQLLRSALLFGATLCFFFAISLMGLARAVAVFEITPLMLTAMAYFVLGEQVGLRRWAGVLIGFAGALIIIRPGSEVFSFASLLPMGAAFCFASFSIATRFLGERESPWTSFVYSTLLGSVIASAIVPFHWTTPAPADAALMAAFGIFGGIGQLLLVLAFQHGRASAVAPFSYVGLIFATFWGWSIFAEIPGIWTVTGALVIVGAGLYVWHREQRARRSPG